MMKKNFLPPVHVINAGDMSKAILTSTPSSINVSLLDNVSLQFTWTGTPTGTLAITGSLDNSNFYAVTPSPALTQPTGSATGFVTGINQCPYPYLQITYTKVSGTGTLDVWVCAKEI